MANNEKRRNSIVDMLKYAYIRKIKKWMFCPACHQGKMTINKKSTLWTCEDCGYKLSNDEFQDNYVFWFCDECNRYLNSQDGFDCRANKHICRNCGYENDITFNNVKGICIDCGKTIPDSDATLCIACKELRKRKAKEQLIKVGKLAAGAAVVAGISILAAQATDDENTNYTPLPGGDEGGDNMDFDYVTDSWMAAASEDELRSTEDEMMSALNNMDYDSDEYLQLDLQRIDVVNTIASRFPLNLPHREHGWYLPNDD